MAEVRTQIVTQGASNLPEDRFVNVLHFVGPDTAAVDAGAIATQIDSLWDAVGPYISPYVSRTYQIRSYDMAQAEPRVPIISTHTMGVVGSATGSLPEEVAACVSFTGVPPITARRRGRIYLGPLNSAAITPATVSTPTRLSAAFISAAASIFANLASNTAGPVWNIYSPTTGLMVPIVAGWVDNAFDTQRRRGIDPTARTTWTQIP